MKRIFTRENDHSCFSSCQIPLPLPTLKSAISSKPRNTSSNLSMIPRRLREEKGTGGAFTSLSATKTIPRATGWQSVMVAVESQQQSIRAESKFFAGSRARSSLKRSRPPIAPRSPPKAARLRRIVRPSDVLQSN
jgi:hypothetical protein